MLLARQVILLSVLLGSAMGMRGAVLQFICSLVILVVRSAVITGGHNLNRHYLPRFGVGFLCKFVSLIRVLQRSFRMPGRGCVIPFFVMFRRSTVLVGRKFMLLSRFPVCVVHGVPSRGNIVTSHLVCTAWTKSLASRFSRERSGVCSNIADATYIPSKR